MRLCQTLKNAANTIKIDTIRATTPTADSKATVVAEVEEVSGVQKNQ